MLDFIARGRTPVRTLAEMQALIGRPMAKAAPDDPKLQAQRRAGRRAWQAAGRVAAAGNN